MKIEDVLPGMEVKTPSGIGTVEYVAQGTPVVRLLLGWKCFSASSIEPVSNPYDTLSSIFNEALHRASEGKGKDRHANGKPFDEQPIVALNLTLSSQDGPLFQIQKKCAEASRFYASGERERAENELLDCIVYAAGAVITGRRRE